MTKRRILQDELREGSVGGDSVEAWVYASHGDEWWRYTVTEAKRAEEADHLGDGTEKARALRRQIVFATCFVESFFFELITRYLQWADALEEWRRLRDQSIQNLSFPFSSYRLGQRKMAVEVYRTVKEGGQITVQAPTGIGKTMAVVFPALKAMAEGPTDRLFYLTARTTGRTIAQKNLKVYKKSKNLLI